MRNTDLCTESLLRNLTDTPKNGFVFKSFANGNKALVPRETYLTKRCLFYQ